MQQFAIYIAIDHLTTSGVFSFNGPPGPGKTTLLRDIFAENIVRRARQLVKHESSGDAFLPDSVKVKFAGSDKPCLLVQLRDVWGDVAVPKKDMHHEWTKAGIGSVHTFQGKEEGIVWVVLGCDERRRGAVDWAATKPNLLNVALTRAQNRFFWIGHVVLWRRLTCPLA